MSHRTSQILSCLLLTMLSFPGDKPVTTAAADPAGLRDGEAMRERDAAVTALQDVRTLVGEWKGVAQPKRGSNAGAWSFKAEGAWDFSGTQASLVLRFQPGRPYDSLHFAVEADRPAIQLSLRTDKADSVLLIHQPVENADEGDKGTFVFESANGVVPGVRCTLRMISDIRLAVLFEERASETGGFRRIVECGLTRSGARLASGNTGERQCIVTGGLGTISVSHAGRTYYVCCEGCRQAFEADPEGTLEAYRARLKARNDEPSAPKK